MKTQNQKRKSFNQTMEQLKKEDNMKEEIKPFVDILKKSVIKKRKIASH